MRPRPSSTRRKWNSVARPGGESPEARSLAGRWCPVQPSKSNLRLVGIESNGCQPPRDPGQACNTRGME
jgi:hypothetical protein